MICEEDLFITIQNLTQPTLQLSLQNFQLYFPYNTSDFIFFTTFPTLLLKTPSFSLKTPTFYLYQPYFFFKTLLS